MVQRQVLVGMVGGGRFYTNPNHVGGTGAIFKVNNVRSSSDAETLQLSMDENVLAVASGGGAGKSQQANNQHMEGD